MTGLCGQGPNGGLAPCANEGLPHPLSPKHEAYSLLKDLCPSFYGESIPSSSELISYAL